jgi:hypothetical protein
MVTIEKSLKVTSLFFIVLSINCLQASIYHVAKTGHDGNAGTKDAPFLTLSKAAEILKPGGVCFVGEGVYNETLCPLQSGKKGAPIRFEKWGDEGEVTIAGADAIPPEAWQKVSPDTFKAMVNMPFGHENQVFLGYQMLFEARWPNTGLELLKPALATMEDGSNETRIVDPHMPNYDYNNGKVWVHAPKHWSNWTTSIMSSPKSGEIEIVDNAPFPGPRRHIPVKGAQYYIFGVREALDADNEWFYDAEEKALYIYRKNGKLPTVAYYVKQRMNAIDVRDKAHVHFNGFDIVGATIESNSRSESIVFDRFRILYPYFSSLARQPEHDLSQSDKGVRFLGKHCKLLNSEVAYSSGTGVALLGKDNHVINCYIHDHDFIGTYASCVQLGGQENVISHSTLTRSGRSVVDYALMYKALIQHCDMSYSGMLTSDLGLTYGNVIEGGNSVIRYNVLHDNVGPHFNMGLYYDHGTQNIISHHNIVYGVRTAALLINHYAAYHLIYNNTFIAEEAGFRNRWGNKYNPELNGIRIANNAFSGSSETTGANYYWSNNMVEYNNFDPRKPFNMDKFLEGKGLYLAGVSSIAKGSRPGIGAIEFEGMTFKAGHDFENPPSPNLARSEPLHRNLIQNSAFEHEDHLLPWGTKGEIEKINHPLKIQITEDTDIGRMGRHSIEIVDKGSEIYQKVTGLETKSTYQFAGFFRVAQGEKVALGIRYSDGREFLSPDVTRGSPYWRKANIYFDTDENTREVTVFVRRKTQNGGTVYLDDTGLTLL